jgi:FlaG/FlaF family flagellin (archaellin)
MAQRILMRAVVSMIATSTAAMSGALVMPRTAQAQCADDPASKVIEFRRAVSAAQGASDLHVVYDKYVAQKSRGGLSASEFAGSVNRLKSETVWDDVRGKDVDISIDTAGGGRTRATYSVFSKKYGRVLHETSLVCESGRWKVLEFRVTPAK